jgi:polar amino acid transport system substrate-binding protein
MRKILAVLFVLLAESATAMSPLAPTGTLRLGLVQAPQAGVYFVSLDADGTPHGAAADIGREMAAKLGIKLDIRIYPNSGECTDAVANGEVDVSFMPVDASRAARVAFGAGYYAIESTYLVTAASGLHTLAEVDRAGVRVVGIANTTTIRAATRTLHNTTPIAARSVDEALDLLHSGKGDALALSRDSLNQIVPQFPGSHVVEGGFQQTTISVAVPPGRPDALAVASRLLEDAKHNGTLRRSLDALGLHDEKVVP